MVASDRNEGPLPQLFKHFAGGIVIADDITEHDQMLNAALACLDEKFSPRAPALPWISASTAILIVTWLA